MAYSDYGGYAYRNGERVEERSDAVFSTEGIKSTPGMWPGWALPEGRGGGSYHVLLGDGPVHVALYKQSSVTLFLNGEEKNLVEIAATDLPEGRVWEHEGVKHLDVPYPFTNDVEPTVFEIEGHRLEVRWVEDDNFYCFARLTQPDGIVWTGFSGYGVGAGLEDCGYGFSTSRVVDMLGEAFPS